MLRSEPDGRALVCGQRRGQLQIGEDHPCAAVPAFLPIEFHLDRNALTDLHYVRAVATAHGHLNPLHPAAQRGIDCSPRREEIPSQPDDGHDRGRQDDDINI